MYSFIQILFPIGFKYIIYIFLTYFYHIQPLGISAFPYNESIYFLVSVRRLFFKMHTKKNFEIQTGFYICLST